MKSFKCMKNSFFLRPAETTGPPSGWAGHAIVCNHPKIESLNRLYKKGGQFWKTDPLFNYVNCVYLERTTLTDTFANGNKFFGFWSTNEFFQYPSIRINK